MSRLPEFDYASPYYYMVTLKKLKGLPAFSQITDEPAAVIRRRLGLDATAELPTTGGFYLVDNAITRLFVDVVKTFHEQWWCIEPITCFSVMPDHLHLLIKIREIERRKSLAVIVWQLIKRLELAYFTIVPAAAGTGRTLTPASSPHALTGGGAMVGGAGKRSAAVDCGRPHCFAPDWHDWIVKRRAQLPTFTRYIRENPFRAWLRRQHAAYFGRVTRVSFLGREWFAYGNVALLGLPVLRAFKGHRATAEDSPEWRAAVALAARLGPGGAGVSTFMSPLEKACGRAIGLAGGKWIVLSPEGFGPRWHPVREHERFCAEGRMLFLSLYPEMTRQPTRAELYARCHEMIDLALLYLK